MAHGQPTTQIDGPGLRRRREYAGLTLRAFAKRCREHGHPVSNSQLSKIEREQSRPRPGLLRALASALDIEVADLVKKDAA